MNNYVYCSIWGVGPGRPGDNGYQIRQINKFTDHIEIKFLDEKCVIYNPSDIVKSKNKIFIKEATYIMWENYSYGKERIDENLIYSKYSKISNKSVELIFSGLLKGQYILKIKGNAFELYGEDLENLF